MSSANRFCVDCFLKYIAPDASKSSLLVGERLLKCEGCGKQTEVVMTYFKYGEHETIDSCRRIKD